MSENTSSERKSFVQRLVAVSATDVARLVFLCVLVGFILAAFHLNPRRLWIDFFGTVTEAWSRFIHFLTESAGWAIEYFLLGAIIVIPIWFVLRLLRAMGRR
ncbi:DUF6460 domain-containing protein [Maricaulis sp. CAU 1757]